MRINVNKKNQYFTALSEDISEDEWVKTDFKVVLGVLDRVDTKNPTLGFSLIFNAMQRIKGVLADAVGFPSNKLLKNFQRTGTFGQMTKHQMRDFDMVAISLYYHQHYVNLAAWLMLNRIPPLSKDRGEDIPIIVAGGQALANPEPVAPILDVIVIGEGEEAIVEITKSLKKNKGKPKEDRLFELTKIQGVYVPRFYEERYDGDRLIGHFPLRDDVPKIIKKAFVKDLRNSLLYPPEDTDTHDRYIWDFSSGKGTKAICELEAARGCQNKCSYCALSFFFHPHRKIDGDSMSKFADTCKAVCEKKNKTLKLFISAPDVTGNEFIEEAYDELLAKSIEVVSLDARVDNFTLELATARAKAGSIRALFGVEGYSQRLREMVNKQIHTDEVRRAVQYCWEAGVSQVKLGFIWGFPTQTRDDIDEYLELYTELKKLARTQNMNFINEKTGKGLQMILDCAHTSFKAMAHTPMQYYGFHSKSDQMLYLKTQQDKIHKLYGAGLRGLIISGDDLVKFDMLLIKGDRRLAMPIIELSSQFTYEGGIDGKGVQHIYNLCRKYNAPWKEYLRDRAVGECFPWSFINIGFPTKALEVLWGRVKNADKSLGDVELKVDKDAIISDGIIDFK